MQFQEHFTLEDARALLPQLRRILRDAQLRRKRFAQSEEKLGNMLRQTNTDLGGEPVSSMLMDLLQMTLQLRRVQKMGVQIKDLDRGLVDFPHIREGREVFLCWELDEDEILFWHDLDSGYAGRKRL